MQYNGIPSQAWVKGYEETSILHASIPVSQKLIKLGHVSTSIPFLLLQHGYEIWP